MMQFLWLYIDELVGKGLSLGIILEFLGWGSATLIPLALPLATLLASIMTMGSLGENNELLAMKAAGISLPRIILPIMALSVFISIGAFFVANNLVPVAFNNIYSLRADIGKTREEIKIPTGVFYNGIDNYTIRISDRNPKSGIIYGVMVYDHSRASGNKNLTVADSGSIKLTKDKQNLIFILHNGFTYEESEKSSYLDTSVTMQRIGFKKQQLNVSLSNYAFQRSSEGRFRNEVMSQNINQLSKRRDSLDTLYSKVKIYQIRSLLSSGGLAYPGQFDTTGFKKMKYTYPKDSLFVWKNLYNKKNGYLTAMSEMQNAMTLIDNFVFDENQQSAPLRRVKIEWFRKFTLSLACLIFFFIGAPLGAIIRKGGLGTPVIVSMFFFVIYWVVDISGKKLATDGAISPAFGTLVSTLVLFPMGVFLTWKSTRDSSLFNADVYISFFRKLGAKAGFIIKNNEQK
jgi:lipopolysaccharide export system permease protein